MASCIDEHFPIAQTRFTTATITPTCGHTYQIPLLHKDEQDLYNQTASLDRSCCLKCLYDPASPLVQKKDRWVAH
jgi:hypothetical protein